MSMQATGFTGDQWHMILLDQAFVINADRKSFVVHAYTAFIGSLVTEFRLTTLADYSNGSPILKPSCTVVRISET